MWTHENNIFLSLTYYLPGFSLNDPDWFFLFGSNQNIYETALWSFNKY